MGGFMHFSAFEIHAIKNKKPTTNQPKQQQQKDHHVKVVLCIWTGIVGGEKNQPLKCKLSEFSSFSNMNG